MDEFPELGDQILGRYEVTDWITCHGEGPVVKATDTTTGAPVAIKCVHGQARDPEFKIRAARLRRHANIRINHPRVVDAIDFGQEDDGYFLIMPFVEGVDVQRHVADVGGCCIPDRARAILMDIGDGLEAMHAHPLRTAEDLKGRGAVIDVVGVGDDPSNVDERLLRKVASTINNEVHYRFLKDTNSLVQQMTVLGGKSLVGA